MFVWCLIDSFTPSNEWLTDWLMEYGILIHSLNGSKLLLLCNQYLIETFVRICSFKHDADFDLWLVRNEKKHYQVYSFATTTVYVYCIRCFTQLLYTWWCLLDCLIDFILCKIQTRVQSAKVVCALCINAIFSQIFNLNLFVWIKLATCFF